MTGGITYLANVFHNIAIFAFFYCFSLSLSVSLPRPCLIHCPTALFRLSPYTTSSFETTDTHSANTVLCLSIPCLHRFPFRHSADWSQHWLIRRILAIINLPVPLKFTRQWIDRYEYVVGFLLRRAAASFQLHYVIFWVGISTKVRWNQESCIGYLVHVRFCYRFFIISNFVFKVLEIQDFSVLDTLSAWYFTVLATIVLCAGLTAYDVHRGVTAVVLGPIVESFRLSIDATVETTGHECCVA